MQKECSVDDTMVLSGGSFISDTAVGPASASTDPTYPISYELRESTFMFHKPVDLGAGSYKICWKAEGGNLGVELGSFNIEGKEGFSAIDAAADLQ